MDVINYKPEDTIGNPFLDAPSNGNLFLNPERISTNFKPSFLAKNEENEDNERGGNATQSMP